LLLQKPYCNTKIYLNLINLNKARGAWKRGEQESKANPLDVGVLPVLLFFPTTTKAENRGCPYAYG